MVWDPDAKWDSDETRRVNLRLGFVGVVRGGIPRFQIAVTCVFEFTTT